MDKEKRDKEERHKAMMDDIKKKKEEFKAKNILPSAREQSATPIQHKE